jgi:hypothetical protein
VFIYTCPSGSKIKERMVYASTKQGFVASAEKEFGIEVAKRVSCLLSPFVLGAKVPDGIGGGEDLCKGRD